MVIVVTAYKGHVGPLQAGRQAGRANIIGVCRERFLGRDGATANQV